MKVNSSRKSTGFGNIDSDTGSLPLSDNDIIAFAKRQSHRYDITDKTEWLEYAKDSYSEIISLAERLKAQHQDDATEYADSFYLEYAQRQLGIQELRYFNAMTTHKLGIGEIDDPVWSQYSPDEIVNMHENGFQVPKDILIWAQSRKETDLTSYIVLSDESGVDGEGEAGIDSNVNNLKKKTSDYIIKSTLAQKNLDNNSKNIKDNQKEVEQLQNKRKDKKSDIDKIKEKTEELKKLDEKNQKGSLNPIEKARFKKLKKELGEDSSKIQEMKATEKKLNDFLDSIDSLEQEAHKDIELATNTIDAGEDLADVIKSYNINELVSSKPEELVAENRGIQNVLAGAQLSELPEISSKIGTELQNTSEDVLSNLSDEQNTNLKEFAKDYTQKAENIGNTLHTEEGDLTYQAEYDNSKSQKINNITNGFMGAFGFLMPLMSNPVIALAYAMATDETTELLKQNRTDIKTDSNGLNKDIKNQAVTSKKLEEVINKGEEKQENNTSEIEAFLIKLAEFEEKQNSNAIKPESEDQTKIENKTTEENPETETSQIISDVKNLENEIKQIAKEIQIPLTGNKKILGKNSQVSTELKANNTEFKKSATSTKQMATLAAINGPYAMGIGVYNLSIASSLLSAGLSMLPFLPTHALGQLFCNVGLGWLGIGTSQVGTGTKELTAGIEGLEETSESKEQYQTNKEILSNEKISSKLAKTINTNAEKKLESLGISTSSGETSNNNPNNKTQEKSSATEIISTQLNEKVGIDITSKHTGTVPAIEKLSTVMPKVQNAITNSTNQDDSGTASNITSTKEKIISNAEKLEAQTHNTDNENIISNNINRTENNKNALDNLTDNDSDSNIKTPVENAKVRISSLIDKENEQLKKVLSNSEDENIEDIPDEEKQNIPEASTEIRSNDSVRSAAASTHISLSDKIETDEKTEKKLTRFNNDSIIESRRKARRVTGISSTSKKRA